MKINRLIKQLEQIRDEYGDVEVFVSLAENPHINKIKNPEDNFSIYYGLDLEEPDIKVNSVNLVGQKPEGNTWD